jgi:hypothetical protein
VGNDPRYNHSRCYKPFPFPEVIESQKVHIRELAEQLDAHRKRQQAQHPRLTMTDMYNVLEKLRMWEKVDSGQLAVGSGQLAVSLSDTERRIHEAGLVSVLKQLHDELDAAVFEAYGWPRDLSDEEILERLVALNAERAVEEARGLIRYLRPDYQAPETAVPRQRVLIEAEEQGSGVGYNAGAEEQSPVSSLQALPWPEGMAARAQAVRGALAALGRAATAGEVAGMFGGRRTPNRVKQVGELLETLAALGQAREVEGGVFAAE